MSVVVDSKMGSAIRICVVIRRRRHALDRSGRAVGLVDGRPSNRGWIDDATRPDRRQVARAIGLQPLSAPSAGVFDLAPLLLGTTHALREMRAGDGDVSTDDVEIRPRQLLGAPGAGMGRFG